MLGLKRKEEKGYIGGVCSGIAEWSGTSAIAWRIIFILVPYGLWVYLALLIMLKQNNDG